MPKFTFPAKAGLFIVINCFLISTIPVFAQDLSPSQSAGQSSDSTSTTNTSSTQNSTQESDNPDLQTLKPCSQTQPGQVCRKDSGQPQGTSPNIQNIQTMDASDRQAEERARREALEEQGQLQQTLSKPLPINDFQNFVTLSIGRKLPIYGYDLFQNVPSTFAPVDRVPVSADYVIGPGDEIVIRAWGQIDINYRAAVDRTGNIYIPKVGQINVAGIRYQQLQDYLKNAISRVYRNFDLTVTLGQLRSIKVFVVGQARRPGTYTVSSLSTMVNTLFASGGPSSSGSLRGIQLKRNGEVVTTLDLYDLLLNGDKSKDTVLQPGDVIFIPPIGHMVAVAGQVNVPAIYEIKDNTDLAEALRIAGGLTITAEGQKVTVERILDRQARKVYEFPLDASGLSQKLQDGDVVNVFPLSYRFENAVTLRGNVAMPGRFPWHEGMRIRDLIPTREALITPEYYLKHNSAARTYLAPLDTQTGEQSQQPEAAGQQVEAARQGQQAARQEELHNEVKRNAAEINWDYAVIQRLYREDLTSTLIPFNLGKAILGSDLSSNLLLEPGDIVTIFSQADLQVPIQEQSKYVKLEGELVQAGVYKAEPGETLRHLVARVGGFTPNAYLYGAQLTRESVRLDQQKKLDEINRRLSQDVERSVSFKSQNLTNPGDAAALPAIVESQRRLVAELKTIKATGRIVMNIRPNENSVDALPELVLEDGDRLVVSYMPATVSVLGAVYNQADILYRPGRRVADYLREAGGPTRTADKRKIYVMHANGSVQGSEGGSWLNGGITSMRVLPGDTIVVPEQVNKTTLIKNLIDYTQIMYQLGLGAAAIRVLR